MKLDKKKLGYILPFVNYCKKISKTLSCLSILALLTLGLSLDIYVKARNTTSTIEAKQIAQKIKEEKNKRTKWVNANFKQVDGVFNTIIELPDKKLYMSFKVNKTDNFEYIEDSPLTTVPLSGIYYNGDDKDIKNISSGHYSAVSDEFKIKLNKNDNKLIEGGQDLTLYIQSVKKFFNEGTSGEIYYSYCGYTYNCYNIDNNKNLPLSSIKNIQLKKINETGIKKGKIKNDKDCIIIRELTNGVIGDYAYTTPSYACLSKGSQVEVDFSKAVIPGFGRDNTPGNFVFVEEISSKKRYGYISLDAIQF